MQPPGSTGTRIPARQKLLIQISVLLRGAIPKIIPNPHLEEERQLRIR
ncbi:hypothetical protein BMS3Abin05_02144 [bacterium BMS3Abin05]|nr:hypothetical protein BMS3Abin05_02144 [bacterium BMS3Abin05]GBE28345.1 hypothetical protein BMS3Bbin03_02284 [bacterium BMS3Bbin03]